MLNDKSVPNPVHILQCDWVDGRQTIEHINAEHKNTGTDVDPDTVFAKVDISRREDISAATSHNKDGLRDGVRRDHKNDRDAHKGGKRVGGTKENSTISLKVLRTQVS